MVLFSFVFSNFIIAGAFDASATDRALNASVSTDLTQLGREGRLRQNPSFEKETAKLIEVLGNDGTRQPVIIDETGNYRDIVVEQLAIGIAAGNVPDALKDKTILKLETPVVFSNARSNAEATTVVNTVLDKALAAKGRTILFVDELTQFIGSQRENAKLREAIETHRLQVIGGSDSTDFAQYIESSKALNSLFEKIDIRSAHQTEADDQTADANDYAGDNVSPDLRDMMANDPSGKTRVDVILQAKDADSPVLRTLFAQGNARIRSRVGTSDTLIVNLPLSMLQELSLSGMMNYVSPNRPTVTTGHVETTTGATMVRNQPALGSRPSYTLDGSGVGVAILDSGIYADAQRI